jgi:hypothetical protein
MYAKVLGFNYGWDRLFRELALGTLLIPALISEFPDVKKNNYCALTYFNSMSDEYLYCSEPKRCPVYPGHCNDETNVCCYKKDFHPEHWCCEEGLVCVDIPLGGCKDNNTGIVTNAK